MPWAHGDRVVIWIPKDKRGHEKYLQLHAEPGRLVATPLYGMAVVELDVEGGGCFTVPERYLYPPSEIGRMTDG